MERSKVSLTSFASAVRLGFRSSVAIELSFFGRSIQCPRPAVQVGKLLRLLLTIPGRALWILAVDRIPIEFPNGGYVKETISESWSFV